MFQTEERPELILRAGDECKAEPRARAAEGEPAVAALSPVPQKNYPPLYSAPLQIEWQLSS